MTDYITRSTPGTYAWAMEILLQGGCVTRRDGYRMYILCIGWQGPHSHGKRGKPTIQSLVPHEERYLHVGYTISTADAAASDWECLDWPSWPPSEPFSHFKIWDNKDCVVLSCDQEGA